MILSVVKIKNMREGESGENSIQNMFMDKHATIPVDLTMSNVTVKVK